MAVVIFAPVEINLLGFKVNVLDHASVLNLGPHQVIDQFISYKRNQGYGEQNGDIVPFIIPIGTIWDNDMNDSLSVKNSIL
jgi:hypothetical protein